MRPSLWVALTMPKKQHRSKGMAADRDALPHGASAPPEQEAPQGRAHHALQP